MIYAVGAAGILLVAYLWWKHSREGGGVGAGGTLLTQGGEGSTQAEEMNLHREEVQHGYKLEETGQHGMLEGEREERQTNAQTQRERLGAEHMENSEARASNEAKANDELTEFREGLEAEHGVGKYAQQHTPAGSSGTAASSPGVARPAGILPGGIKGANGHVYPNTPHNRTHPHHMRTITQEGRGSSSQRRGMPGTTSTHHNPPSHAKKKPPSGGGHSAATKTHTPAPPKRHAPPHAPPHRNAHTPAPPPPTRPAGKPGSKKRRR
jgi:hypothetical protein